MNKNIYTSLIACLVWVLALNTTVSAQNKKLHTIRVNTVQELHDFFRYSEHRKPIVSGHRGGMEQGFPENSTATFENTLSHTPAFFEIDPRLSKDSVIVLMHDATLERTTNGIGKVSDYTWEELKKLKLKDADGNLTEHRIPSLEEAIEWARGKTILSLDYKGVPYAMTAKLITRLRATHFVMVGIQNLKQAQFYLTQDKGFMFARYIKSRETLAELQSGGIPLNQVMAYVGPVNKPENKELYRLIHQKGMMCMIAAAPVYDKLKSREERKLAYQQIIQDKVDIIESDRPVEVAEALKSLNSNAKK